MMLPSPPVPATATLQANLAAAQAALGALLTGQQIATASYGQGEGTKMVTYRRTDIGSLTSYIQTLQKQLGYRSRRAIGVMF